MTRVVQLVNLLHASHERWELLELCPLLVGHLHGTATSTDSWI